MATPEETPFHLEKAEVAGSAVGGLFPGVLGVVMWEANSTQARNAADSTINAETNIQVGLEDAVHTLTTKHLEDTPAGQAVNHSLTAQSQKVEALVAHKPVVHEARDAVIGIGGAALGLVALNVAFQYRRHQKRQQKISARTQPA